MDSVYTNASIDVYNIWHEYFHTHYLHPSVESRGLSLSIDRAYNDDGFSKSTHDLLSLRLIGLIDETTSSDHHKLSHRVGLYNLLSDTIYRSPSGSQKIYLRKISLAYNLDLERLIRAWWGLFSKLRPVSIIDAIKEAFSDDTWQSADYEAQINRQGKYALYVHRPRSLYHRMHL